MIYQRLVQFSVFLNFNMQHLKVKHPEVYRAIENEKVKKKKEGTELTQTSITARFLGSTPYPSMKLCALYAILYLHYFACLYRWLKAKKKVIDDSLIDMIVMIFSLRVSLVIKVL